MFNNKTSKFVNTYLQIIKEESLVNQGFFKKVGQLVKTKGGKNKELVRLFNQFCSNNGFKNTRGDHNPNGKPNIFVKEYDKDFLKIVRDANFLKDPKATQMKVLVKFNDDADTQTVIVFNCSDTENEFAKKIKDAAKRLGGNAVEVFDVKNPGQKKAADKADKKGQEVAPNFGDEGEVEEQIDEENEVQMKQDDQVSECGDTAMEEDEGGEGEEN